jgi:hypothetical protein
MGVKVVVGHLEPSLKAAAEPTISRYDSGSHQQERPSLIVAQRWQWW